MPTRAFIAYDFALIDGTMFANVLEDAQASQPDTLEIHYPAAPGDPKDQGTIWRSMVRREIEQADRFLAFIDLPNANVGFEIGYAFGSGKPVSVYRFKSSEHRWLKEPPLRGHFRHRASTAEQIHDAFLKDIPLALKNPPAGGDGVVILCPQNSGSSLLKQIDPTWGWSKPPFSEWDIETLPQQFNHAGLVVWIITSHGEGPQERDGTENTALSILAGYAEARPELSLRVCIHSSARPVADVEHVSKRFSTNAELKTLLSALHAEWQSTLAARAAPPPALVTAATVAAPIVLPSLWSQHMPPHPHDPFPDTATRFIGREAQLGTGSDAVDGMLERLNNPTRLSGGRAVQWIWAHGFGGMGKSWCLHRIRCLAEAAHSQVRSLIIDWDKPDWLAPLAGEPRNASDVFDLIAIRLCQRLDEHAADPYREAKARVNAAATEHKRTRDRFEQHLQLASTGAGSGADSHLIQRLREEDLWHDDPAKRETKLKALRENRLRYREMLTAWATDCGEVDSAVICPMRELASGLRVSLSAAMRQHPLIVVLDTCEILSDDLDFWLRELFVPLITECAPILLLMGSRLRPDLHQLRGSRRGWLAELPGAACRIEDFGESLRFKVLEIEYALDQLKRPVPGDHERLAEVLHRVTLGVPLAVRGLLDLHEDGNDVLDHLTAPAAEDEPLSESEAVRKAIADVSERWLYNLETKPERAEDLQDIIALALLPVLDTRLMREHWQPKTPHVRLRELSHKYSLLSDGDLHPSVRSYLRRHWRDEANRPECLPQVLDCLAHHYAKLSSDSPPNDRVHRVQHRIATLNLRSWREGDAILPALSPVLCLARVYELEDLTLENLLSELPLAGGTHSAARKLWHRDDGQLPDNKEILPWLRIQRAASQTWTAEEDAALALLEGIALNDWAAPSSIATAAFANLEHAFEFFGLEALPLPAAVGEAYFKVGWTLDSYPMNKSELEFVRTAASAYERAITLHCREVASYNNVANLYAANLQQPEKAEQFYLKSIELDPKDASPYNGLGNLYQGKGHFLQPEKAEQSYLKAIALDPELAYSHYGLGNLYQDHLQQLEKAEQSYLKAIAFDPKFADPHNGLGSLYQNHLQQPEKAEQSYLKAIALDPKFASPYNGLGHLYQDLLQQPEKAEQSYLKAIELDPQMASPHNGLGNLYQYRFQKPEKAAQAYRKAIELDPKFDFPYHGLGMLYESAGCWPQAVAEFEQSMALDAKGGGGQRGLAWVALRSASEVDEALRWAEQSLTMEPEHPGNSLIRIAVEVWEGDWAQALVLWSIWVSTLPLAEEWFLLRHHDRIAVMLRYAHTEGRLEEFAAVLRASPRPCWKQFAQAVDALLQGRDAVALPDARAALIFRLLQTPDATAAPPAPKTRKRKKP